MTVEVKQSIYLSHTFWGFDLARYEVPPFSRTLAPPDFHVGKQNDIISCFLPCSDEVVLNRKMGVSIVIASVCLHGVPSARTLQLDKIYFL